MSPFRRHATPRRAEDRAIDRGENYYLKIWSAIPEMLMKTLPADSALCHPCATDKRFVTLYEEETGECRSLVHSLILWRGQLPKINE